MTITHFSTSRGQGAYWAAYKVLTAEGESWLWAASAHVDGRQKLERGEADTDAEARERAQDAFRRLTKEAEE